MKEEIQLLKLENAASSKRANEANSELFYVKVSWLLIIFLQHNFRVYLGVKTCEVFLCFVTIMFVLSFVLTSLSSLFYVTHEGDRFLHRGWAQLSLRQARLGWVLKGTYSGVSQGLSLKGEVQCLMAILTFCGENSATTPLLGYKIIIGHCTAVYSVTRPMNGSEAAGDLVLIQASLFLSCKSCCCGTN